MSSTNKTTHYNLSKYIGTDKPTYLGDYNSDMSKIDSAIHDVNEIASNASENAGSAVSRVSAIEKTVQTQTQNINTLQTDVSGLKESVKTAQETATSGSAKADSAQQTANSALLTANNASAKADNVNKDVTLWTGSLKNGNITLNDSLSNYRFLYVETNMGVSPIFAYRNDKRSYVGCQSVASDSPANTVQTAEIKLTIRDDTHIAVHTSVISHTFSSTHPALDAVTLLGVYGVPR